LYPVPTFEFHFSLDSISRNIAEQQCHVGGGSNLMQLRSWCCHGRGRKSKLTPDTRRQCIFCSTLL